MTTLQEIFADLQAQWRDRRLQAGASLERHLERVEEQAPMLRAVIAHRRGDTSAIPRLLRSGYRLTIDDQQTLAQFLEGGFDPPPKAGRPKSNERWVGMQADFFLAEWRQIARANGVSTYGQSAEMRDQAVEFIISEFVPPDLRINRDAAFDYMTKRGKERRN